MKIIFKVFIFIFINTSLFSQKAPQSGEVVYTIKMNPVRLFKNVQQSSEFKKIQHKVDKIIPELRFNLKFNKNNSLFSINSDMEIDGEGFLKGLAIISTRGKSIFFVDSNKKLILEKTSLLNKDYLIQSSTNDLQWKLINEQKKIGIYTCFKAIASRKNKGPLKETIKSFNYIVWYCPAIPFNFGPYEFTGLPGLILEFSNGQLIYTASKIKLNERKIKINKPTEGDLITKEEFKKIGKRLSETMN